MVFLQSFSTKKCLPLPLRNHRPQAKSRLIGTTSQPCLESTAEPTCLEQQQDPWQILLFFYRKGNGIVEFCFKPKTVLHFFGFVNHGFVFKVHVRVCLSNLRVKALAAMVFEGKQLRYCCMRNMLIWVLPFNT